MPLSDLALAYLLTTGAHTAGHFNEANNYSAPMTLSGTNEIWDSSKLTPQAIDQVNGAGFRGQDLAGKALQGTMAESPVRLATGLYKLLYMAGLPKFLGSKGEEGGLVGDDEYLAARHGDLGTKGALGFSAIGDIWKSYNPKSEWDVGFDQSTNGAPMLRIDKKW